MGEGANEWGWGCACALALTPAPSPSRGDGGWGVLVGLGEGSLSMAIGAGLGVAGLMGLRPTKPINHPRPPHLSQRRPRHRRTITPDGRGGGDPPMGLNLSAGRGW